MQKAQTIAVALADDDKDGWFTDVTNVAVTLNLASGAFSLPGNYQIVVDEVRFPLAPNLEGTFPVNIAQLGATLSLGATPVATRMRGVTGFGASGTPFSATVRVVRPLPLLPPQIVGVATVPFGETAGPLAPVTIGSGIFGTQWTQLRLGAGFAP